MASFLRNKTQIIAGATICSVPILNYWWRNGGQDFNQNIVVFAHERPPDDPPTPYQTTKPKGSGAFSGTSYHGSIDDIRHDLIASVPQLKQRQTDPKYIQLPPPIEELTLKNVHIFFRHGARMPLRPSPMKQVTWDKDMLLSGVPFTMIKYQLKYLDGTPCNEFGRVEKIYRKHVFDGGSFGGQLTNLGQDQMYQLGVECRKRYLEERQLVPDVYKREYVYAQSTNIMRTIESTRCVIAGLFGAESFDESGAVAEIVVSKDTDEILYPNFRMCDVLVEIAKRGRSALSKIKGERKLRKQCMDKLGITDSAHTSQLLALIRDEILCRQAHGLPIQENLQKLVPQILDFGEEVCMLSTVGVKEDLEKYLLLAVGPLFHMILENMDKVFHNNNSPAKINLYGVHDTTIIPMLLAMKAYDGAWPDYAANIKFELYEDCLGDHWVRILHCDKEITLPNCENSVCRYEQFRDEFSHLNITVNQFTSICCGKEHKSLLDRLFKKTFTPPEDDIRTVPASM
ncbi:lysophosphatidic acid phosphatase type 6-like [Lineus longissimus]|uniref:lysophosphatidic acid phosphatase type 6-like n=1 Tax=Lineus longissimus TaxID=88925 RepID=UPI00315CB5C7